jgi:hypothetical protein
MPHQVVDTLVHLVQTLNAPLVRSAMHTQHVMKLIPSCAELLLRMHPQTAMNLVHQEVLPNVHLESLVLHTRHANRPRASRMNLQQHQLNLISQAIPTFVGLLT